MAHYGPKARMHARATKSFSLNAAEKREWEPKVPEACTSVSISQKHTATPTAKRQGSLTDSSILMSKFYMHMFMRIPPKIQSLSESRDSNPPANQRREDTKRSNTWPVPVQGRANARLYLRRATK